MTDGMSYSNECRHCADWKQHAALTTEKLESMIRRAQDAEEELAQTKQALAELRAAVDAAPHDLTCSAISRNGLLPLGNCDCWKSRVPKC